MSNNDVARAAQALAPRAALQIILKSNKKPMPNLECLFLFLFSRFDTRN